MIAFSLGRDINPQEVISGISELIKREVDSQEDANASVLVISISKISQVIDSFETKCIEA